MTYEEKRALHIEISQMLADAGLNKSVIKEMVDAEIKNKVDNVVNGKINRLNAETSNGDYIRTKIDKIMADDSYFSRVILRSIVTEILKDRVIKVVMERVESEVKPDDLDEKFDDKINAYDRYFR